MTELRRLRFVASVSASTVDKKSREHEPEVRLCNYVDVYYHERIDSELDFMVATAPADQIRRFGLKRNDILITKDSESPDDIGVPALVTNDMPGVVCGYHLSVIRPSPSILDASYLFWVLASSISRQYFAAEAQGITRFGLRRDSILNLPVPFRPLDEQRRLASFLDAETGRIDSLVELDRRPSTTAPGGYVGRLIHLLRERRQALITAAVTGELEISGVPA